MADVKIIEHGLYRLKDGGGWCRHGLIRVIRREDAGLIAVDTYWHASYSVRDFYDPETIKDRLEFIIDLSKCRKTVEHEWTQFADKDRTYIPMGGGSAQWLVRKDAKPFPARQIEQLEFELERLRSKMETAKWDIERKENELAALREVKP